MGHMGMGTPLMSIWTFPLLFWVNEKSVCSVQTSKAFSISPSTSRLEISRVVGYWLILYFSLWHFLCSYVLREYCHFLWWILVIIMLTIRGRQYLPTSEARREIMPVNSDEWGMIFTNIHHKKWQYSHCYPVNYLAVINTL